MKSRGYATALPGTSACGNTESFQWICAGYGREVRGGCDVPCEERLPGLRASGEAVWRPDGKEAEYCLAMPMGDRCKLQASAALFWIVTGTSLVKMMLFVLLALRSREGRLLTVGDAIASFLENPSYSGESGPLCRDDVVEKRPLEARRVFSGERRRGTAAASRRRWAACICLWIMAILFALILLAWGVSTLGKADIKASTMYSWGIGAINARTTINFEAMNGARRKLPTQTLLVLVSAISNAPQLVLSLLYLAYNGLFTSVCLAREWSRFGWGVRKGLRVSSVPRGKQRSDYFLQLPYRYGVPLLGGSILMHWLVGQSLFLVAIDFYETGPDGAPRHRPKDTVISSGWSPLGITLVAAVGTVMLCVLGIVSRRRMPTAMPLVASCSVAIAAACHAPAEETDQWLWEKEVQWGIPIDDDVKRGTDERLCFTSKEVLPPVAGEVYR
ncbi:hypothetical protein QBC39DRAFT_343361 [Podospora conica]|nr:hypothetical protein QBC39DRAFT_343361 [Schizothecium conicum]